MKSATMWFFACSLVAVMANERKVAVLEEALEGRNENYSGDSPRLDVSSVQSTNYHRIRRKLEADEQDNTGVVPDVVNLQNFTYKIMDPPIVIDLEFYNASLEGLSLFKLVESIPYRTIPNLGISTFKVNYDSITFRADLNVSWLFNVPLEKTTFNCSGQATVKLKNLTVAGNLLSYTDGENLEPEIHVTSSTMSTKNFQPTITGCEWEDQLAKSMRDQLGSDQANRVKQILINRVNKNIVDHSSSVAHSVCTD